MALDATVGTTTANSYVTATEAEDYFADRAHATAWEDVEDKEKILITSSQMLDWYVTWKGIKTDPDQSMQFPRTDVVRPDATELDTDIIPPEVKIAVYELALVSLTEDRTVESDLAGIEQVKVSSLMIKAEAKDANSSSRDTIPDKVWNILSDLTNRSSIHVVRLVRA